LVETKRGAKRASGSKKAGGASARPLIHSSHGSGGKRASRHAEGGEAPPFAATITVDKHAPRLSVSRAQAAPPRPSRAKAEGGAAPRLRKAKAPASGPGESLASDGARELAVLIATAALDKKAVGLEVLDVAGKVDYADFLVLMTGRSDRQVQALAQGIEEALRQKGRRPMAIEGLPHASWVLMDFGDVVVHVFQEDARSSYDLDGLWMDARRIPLPIPDELR